MAIEVQRRMDRVRPDMPHGFYNGLVRCLCRDLEYAQTATALDELIYAAFVDEMRFVELQVVHGD